MAVLQHMPARAMATVHLHAMPDVLVVVLAGCASSWTQECCSILQQSSAAAYCHLHSDSSCHKLHEDHAGLAWKGKAC